MAWTVIAARAVKKQLAKLPAKDQGRILVALLAMGDNPFSGDIIKLEREGNRWRRRVGNYRIFFAVDAAAKKVDISAVERRTSTTY